VRDGVLLLALSRPLHLLADPRREDI
jgi:hypothetical protein